MDMEAPPVNEARVIRGLIAETGITKSEIAAVLNVSTETLRRRLHSPGTWTLAQVDAVAPLLGTTAEAIIRRALGEH